MDLSGVLEVYTSHPDGAFLGSALWLSLFLCLSLAEQIA